MVSMGSKSVELVVFALKTNAQNWRVGLGDEKYVEHVVKKGKMFCEARTKT